MKEIYEKLNLFYLGEQKDKNFDETKDLMLLKNKSLTTHAAIIGMTGSGKTGLGISLLEEAVLDEIPAIVIDPKGDMGNLLFVDDEFKSSSFENWVEKGVDATSTAKFWEDGIKSSKQDRKRVSRFKNSADFSIYTPGATHGIPLSILNSFDAPSQDILDNPDLFKDLLDSTITSILSLVAKENDPLSSEYVLLGAIFSHFWKKNLSLGLHEIISNIIKPPFTKIGMLPLESMFAQEDRLKFAMLLNNLVSSASFESWIKGEPLDIHNILYTADAKPRVAIFSISHLNDEERMFFVTLLLNKYLSYMRGCDGSSRLKTILYMDEIYGFFPATSNPSSKKPMMTLLKQARAFGTGVILSTQNPIDLDYKGLSNIGTWFLGRLQTKQDINRVIDGLSKSEGELDKKEISNILANMPKRTFLLKSNSLDSLRIFSTRWVMSYLAGPLSNSKITSLMKEKIKKAKNKFIPKVIEKGSIAPIVPKEWEELFLNNIADDVVYEPFVKVQATVKFVDKTRGIEEIKKINHTYFLDDKINSIDFNEFEEFENESLDTKALSKASYLELPKFIHENRSLKNITKDFKNFLYQNQRIDVFKMAKIKSNINESLEEFKQRVNNLILEEKEEELEKLALKLDKQKKVLETKLTRAMGRLEEEQEDVKSSKMDAFMSFGMTILDAFMGGGKSKSTISKAGRSMKKAGKIYNEKNDVKRAEQLVITLQEDIQTIDLQFEDKVKQLNKNYNLANYELITTFLKPRRSDIYDIDIKLLWVAS